MSAIDPTRVTSSSGVGTNQRLNSDEFELGVGGSGDGVDLIRLPAGEEKYGERDDPAQSRDMYVVQRYCLVLMDMGGWYGIWVVTM
jgi:hypothetical protein